ncbi:MAG: hydroxymethylglutaryl-CoA reductase [Bacteroidota bacterium]
MTSSSNKARKTLQILNTNRTTDLIEKLKSTEINNFAETIFRTDSKCTKIKTETRITSLEKATNTEIPFLSNKVQFNNFDILPGNIENYIGMTQIPTGIIGPIKVKGIDAYGDFYAPLATTEGALIASYNRGARAAYLSGGITSVCLTEGVQRSPVFTFESIGDLASFLMWALEQDEKFKEITTQNSRFAKLSETKVNIEGNNLILVFEFYTGDAAGQNMVTICTDAICSYIIENCPIKPEYWFLEGNYSGDKKATALSFTNVRGKKVVAEVIIPQNIVVDILKTTPELIVKYWQTSTIGVIQSGAIGAQGHFANGLAALFLATGQDVACVTEAAIGITRMEHHKNGGIYVSVTLPNLIVGTVGGGTILPTQQECLNIMDCNGAGKARKFAEICAAVVLSGEISIAAAISAGQFSHAHKKLGRKK